MHDSVIITLPKKWTIRLYYGSLSISKRNLPANRISKFGRRSDFGENINSNCLRAPGDILKAILGRYLNGTDVYDDGIVITACVLEGEDASAGNVFTLTLGLCLSSCRLAFVVCWIHSPPPCVVVKSLFSCTIPWRLSLSSYRVAPWTAGWLVLNVCRSYVQSILRNFWNLLSRQHCELTIKSGRKIVPFLRWHLSQYPFGWSNFWFISVLCVGTF